MVCFFFHVHVDAWIQILKRLTTTQNYSEIWDFLDILRGSCFVAQAGLELVVLLITGIIGACAPPHPAKMCLLKSHSCCIIIWEKQLEMRSEGEPCQTTVPCFKDFLSSHSEDCFQLQVRVKPATQP